MKAFRGAWTISVGLLLAATAANAQGAPSQGASNSGYRAVSDFSGPYGDVPPGPPMTPYGRPPAYGAGPAEYGAGYGAPLLPPTEVYAVVRENGFSPLGAPRLRGLFYSISAIDRRGEDGRLVIDARDGRIVRFAPAEHFGGYGGGYGGDNDGYYDGARRPSYGPLEPMPRLDGTRLEGPQRPPGAMPPKVASRMPSTVSVPKAAPQRPANVKPLAEKPVSAPAPMQQSAAVQPKPAVSSPEAKPPAASALQPTQPMPKVQDFE